VLAGALLVWPCVGSIYHEAGRRSTARSRYRASLRNPEGIETARSIERDNVRFGSLADIGEGYQGCPLYPPDADMLIVGIDVCYVPTSDMAQRYPRRDASWSFHIVQGCGYLSASLADITTTRAIQLEIPPRCAL
jgi:hypothetical protein